MATVDAMAPEDAPTHTLPLGREARDDTLIAHLATLTVEERIALNDAAVRAVLALRAAWGQREADALAPAVDVGTGS